MKTRLIIQIGLAIVVVILAYFLYESIMEPVRFESEFNNRKAAVVVKLKEIRTLEEAYKAANGRYCGDIDSLVMFMEQGQVKLVQKQGDVPDTLTEEQALKKGLITRDTILVNPLEKLRQEGKINMTKEQLKNLKYIPYSDNEEFEISVGFVPREGFEIPVIEVKAPFEVFLSDMDEQLVINKIAEAKQLEKYPGWKIGDMKDPVLEGNFE